MKTAEDLSRTGEAPLLRHDDADGLRQLGLTLLACAALLASSALASGQLGRLQVAAAPAIVGGLGALALLGARALRR